MRQALHYLALRLIGDIPQDPFELQDDGLRNEHVAGRKYARGNASLRRIVAEAKVSARQIVLEITERDELQDLDKAAAIVRELCGLGFKVAIDDVGVGHSGLSHLKALGANVMKIDKFFVDTIRDESTSRIVETLVHLARDLQMTVVAEGIETEPQMQSLRDCGVQEGQGYIVSPPLPYAKFAALIEARRARAAAQTIVDGAALVA